MERGIYGVTLTTFDSDGQLNMEALYQELIYCRDTSVKGLLMCGSTGEFIYMNAEQQKKVLAAGMEVAGKNKILIGGASAPTEESVLNLLKYMDKIGYQYALICPPYYFPQTPENVLDFYRTISKKAPPRIKILMYNIPFCAPEIPLQYMEELLAIPYIIGLKDSSGNFLYLSKVMGVVKDKRPDFHVFTGQDACFLPALTLGVSGCISALSWMFDKEENELLESYHQKNLERASEIQMNIIQLVRHLDGISFPENYRILSKVIGVDSGEIQRHFYNLNDVFCYQWIEQMTILVQKLRMS